LAERGVTTLRALSKRYLPVDNDCVRLNEARSWEFSELYYRCNRILVDVLDAHGPVIRPLSLPKRHIFFKEISRLTTPRPQDVGDDRRRLQKLPLFIYNSAPEAEVLEELKDKVCLDSRAAEF